MKLSSAYMKWRNKRMKEWELEDQELVEANNEKQNNAGIKMAM